MNTTAITSLKSYVGVVEDICHNLGTMDTTTLPWFRGQSNAEWDLIPSLYRGVANSEFEREMNRDFVLRASTHLKIMPKNQIEWLFVMQHYGFPTRLLDWTESSLVALFFALKDVSLKHDAAVWILHPWSLNLATIRKKTVPVASHPFLENYVLRDSDDLIGRKVNALKPIAVRSVHSTNRIIAQRGTFTLHGSASQGLNKMDFSTKNGRNRAIKLDKLIIKRSHKDSLLRELYVAGISDSLLFPDLDGLSREIAYRYSDHFLKESSLEPEGDHQNDFSLEDTELDGIDALGDTKLEEIETDVNLDDFGSGSGLLDLSIQTETSDLCSLSDEIFDIDDEIDAVDDEVDPDGDTVILRQDEIQNIVDADTENVDTSSNGIRQEGQREKD